MFSVLTSELMYTGIHFAHKFSLAQHIETSVYIVSLYPHLLSVGWSYLYTLYTVPPNFHVRF
jgi:hypothetical protein